MANEGSLFVIDTAGNSAHLDPTFSENQESTKTGKRALGSVSDEKGGRKKQREFSEKDRKEEARLENLLFVDTEEAVQNFGREKKSKDKKKSQLEDSLFKDSDDDVDPDAQRTSDLLLARLDGLEEKSDDEDNSEQSESTVQAAWRDEDDEAITVDLSRTKQTRRLREGDVAAVMSGSEYSERLKKQFQLLNPQSTEWAKVERTEEEDEGEENLLKSTTRLTSRSASLPSQQLGVERMKDANRQEYSEGQVESVRFHPNSQLLLTAGQDRCLRLFQIDGLMNPKATTMRFDEMPIFNAEFTADGKEIILGGRRPYFFVYDVVAGKATKVRSIVSRQETSWSKFSVSPDNKYLGFLASAGEVVLVSNQTKQFITSLKMGALATSATFTPDGHYLYSSSTEGFVYKWDLRTRRCIYKFYDNGTIPSYLASSKNGAYLASGAENGVVNVYDEALLASNANKPEPKKSINNLTVEINQIRFNVDSQIMAISSSKLKDNLRMVHVPSLTVFSNWPTLKTPLNYVNSLDFSPNGGYFVAGNRQGKALLYRLTHYERA